MTDIDTSAAGIAQMDDLIKRIDAIQSCQVGPSDEWSRATKDGYNQAATDIAMNMLRIHSVQPDQVAVQVKPLVWKWHRDPKDTSEARTQIGSWTIWEINGSAYCYGPDDTCGKPCVGGLEGAKAAAQADYEARILAAIDPAQTEPTTVDASQTSQAIDNARAEGWAAGIEAAAGICADQFAAHMVAAICGEPDSSRNRESAANMAERLLHNVRAITTPSDIAQLLAARDARVRAEAFGPASQLISDAWAETQKAMRKFPQPNYVISKVAEEAGEVVKAAIHCAEGRETKENVVGEIKQAMAMLMRLYIEGDQVHGLDALHTDESRKATQPNKGE